MPNIGVGMASAITVCPAVLGWRWSTVKYGANGVSGWQAPLYTSPITAARLMVPSNPLPGLRIQALTAARVAWSDGDHTSWSSPLPPPNEDRGSKVTPKILIPAAWVSVMTAAMAASIAGAVP